MEIIGSGAEDGGFGLGDEHGPDDDTADSEDEIDPYFLVPTPEDAFKAGPSHLHGRPDVAGPSTVSSSLTEEEDSRYFIHHSTAGQVIRNLAIPTPPIPAADGPTVYEPFTSQIDWDVAQWAIKGSIGHGSFDRFLSIPGVSFDFYYF
jgi:hypothetical protein